MLYSQIDGWRLGAIRRGDGYKIPFYNFTSGSQVETFIKVRDVRGNVRLFAIRLNDEKGVISSRLVTNPKENKNRLRCLRDGSLCEPSKKPRGFCNEMGCGG